MSGAMFMASRMHAPAQQQKRKTHGHKTTASSGQMVYPARATPKASPYTVPNPAGFAEPGWVVKISDGWYGQRYLTAKDIVQNESGVTGYLKPAGGNHEPLYEVFQPFDLSAHTLIDLAALRNSGAGAGANAAARNNANNENVSCVGGICRGITNFMGFTRRRNRTGRKTRRSRR